MKILHVFICILSSVVGLVLILPLCMIGLPFWLVGYLTRKIAKSIDPCPVVWDQAIEFDQKFGWKPKPNLDLYCEAAPHVVFQVTTDRDGWRGKREIRDSDMLVFGDSFAWGYGVDDKEFFADLNPGPKIKSIGVPGYNMVTELLWMKEYSSFMKGKLIVWFIFAGNDLYDNMLPNMYQRTFSKT